MMDIPNPEELKAAYDAKLKEGTDTFIRGMHVHFQERVKSNFSSGWVYWTDACPEVTQIIMQEYAEQGWRLDFYNPKGKLPRILFWPNGTENGDPTCWDSIQKERTPSLWQKILNKISNGG